MIPFGLTNFTYQLWLKTSSGNTKFTFVSVNGDIATYVNLVTFISASEIVQEIVAKLSPQPALGQLRPPRKLHVGPFLAASKMIGKGGFTQNAIFIRFCM